MTIDFGFAIPKNRNIDLIISSFLLKINESIKGFSQVWH